jgi:hypothetical protein
MVAICGLERAGREMVRGKGEGGGGGWGRRGEEGGGSGRNEGGTWKGNFSLCVKIN